MINPETIPSEVTAEALFPAATFSANVNGTGLDIKDYLGKIKVTASFGAAADNNQAIDAVIEHSDELAANYTETDVEFAPVIANAAAEVQSVAVDTRATKRYIRVAATRAAAGNGRPVAIIATGKKQVTA
jgi:hypothetical protein